MAKDYPSLRLWKTLLQALLTIVLLNEFGKGGNWFTRPTGMFGHSQPPQHLQRQRQGQRQIKRQRQRRRQEREKFKGGNWFTRLTGMFGHSQHLRIQRQRQRQESEKFKGGNSIDSIDSFNSQASLGILGHLNTYHCSSRGSGWVGWGEGGVSEGFTLNAKALRTNQALP